MICGLKTINYYKPAYLLKYSDKEKDVIALLSMDQKTQLDYEASCWYKEGKLHRETGPAIILKMFKNNESGKLKN